ncbi:MAG TPA: hypothetical protein VHZ55_33170 [Bryobacteraceae bacterium]|nr:hypothetical protein [Bryobacteraceae bacterium]
MANTTVDHLSKLVEQAAEQVHLTFRGRSEESEVLDRFWQLEDDVYRLLEAANDAGGDTIECRDLIRKVVSVLGSAEVFNLSSVPAVKASCEAINEHLIALEHLKQKARAADNVG